MKVSLSWLKDYVPVEMEVSELSDALTMAGLEVDATTDRYDYLEKVIVARIDAIRPHPQADKLQLADVSAGDDKFHVVCGARNIFEGMTVPLALPGFPLPNGSPLKKGKIRGEKSEGMLCSCTELVLGDDAGGIMELDAALVPGTPLIEALSLYDTTIEVDLTPNRPDCLSIIGTAREIAAFGENRVTYPDYTLEDNGNEIDDLTSVTIESPDLCPRYTARLIFDVKVGPSPFWLQDRLNSVGLKPINNVVDITNFVMMETGQPLHAFDFDRLAENRIVVRASKAGDKFTTLDDVERTLEDNMVMICDGEKPVAVGGVMGGLNSEIEETTTRVLLESAYFDPSSIRKTSKLLTLNTDATHRFERGVDPKGTVNALNRAAKLLAEVAGGTVKSGLIDNHPKPVDVPNIRLSVAKTNRLLGLSVDAEKIKGYLTSVEFSVDILDEDSLSVTPPPYRVDVTIPEDLMEEVARLEGYNNIPVTYPMIPAIAVPPVKQRSTRALIRETLTGFGFTEAINYSFIAEDACDRLCLAEEDNRRNMVRLLNPLSEDQAVMRTSVIPGLLATMRGNIAMQERNLRFFEVGKTFIDTGKEQPLETEMLTGLWTGTRGDAHWGAKETEVDFFDLKGVVEALFSALLIKDTAFTLMEAGLCPYVKNGHAAVISVSGKEVGLVGEIAPKVLKNFDLKQKGFIFEIDLDALLPLLTGVKAAQAIPKFPAITRDITIICDKSIPAHDILWAITDTKEVLVESAELFDVYDGKPIPEGKRSVSARITYRSATKTLKDKKVNGIHNKITEMLLKTFEAVLPS